MQQTTLAHFQERQEAGAACLTAWHEGRIVDMDWLFSREYDCPYTGLKIAWPADACYGAELYEHPDFHGKGVGLELLGYSLAETGKRGFRRQVTLVSSRNLKMLGASVQFFGLKAVGEIHTARVLRHPRSTWRIGERTGRGGKVLL